MLDNLCKFYTVNRDKAKPLIIIDLMLMVINASLYHSFLEFFWQKRFRGDKDILKVVKHKFEESMGIGEHINN